MTFQVESKPRFLLWTLSFGREYGALIPFWLSSVFHVGQWRHDVVILGDHHVTGFASSKVHAVDIQPALELEYGLSATAWYSNLIHNAKPRIQFYVDLNRYDFVLYTDVDVLVNTDRLETLLASKCQSGRICVQKDVFPICMNHVFTGRHTLTVEEKLRWGAHAICAGIVGVPVNDLGRSFFQAWHDTNKAGHFRRNDQGNLIALLLRGFGDQWEYIGDSRIARDGPVNRYDETLVHFSGRHHALLRRYSRECLRCSGEVPSIHAPSTSIRN